MSAIYVPSEKFVEVVLAGIMMPLPWYVSGPAKLVPYKEKAIGIALAQVLPLSLRAIAVTQSDGARLVLTSHGQLTEEVKQSILKRIVWRLVPNEVVDISSELNKEIIRLATEEFEEEGWQLRGQENEVVLLVFGTSFLKVTADTVMDALFDSFDALKGYKERVFKYFGSAERDERNGLPPLVRAALENLREVAAKRLENDDEAEAKVVDVLARAAQELKRN
jgi:hypothetical protein